MDGYHVKAYIYDLSRGLARTMSVPLLGRQINGIWHTSIVVFNEEFFFGGLGIESCPPGCTILGQPGEVFDLGLSHVPFELFMSYLQELAQTSYKASSYNLLNHNCNNFTSEVAQFLTGRDIPAHITNLPAEVLSTPFGQMIKPFIDNVANTPAGGHVLFDTEGMAPAQVLAPGADLPQTPTVSSASDSGASGGRVAGNGIGATVSSSSASHVAHAGQPVTFSSMKPTIDDVRAMHSSQHGTAGPLLVEAAEFVSSRDCSWSISKAHVEAIASAIAGSATTAPSERLGLLLLLQRCIADPRIADLWLLAGSSFAPVFSLAIDSTLDLDLAEASMQTVCNMCSTKAGHNYVVSSVKVPPASCGTLSQQKDAAELLCVSGLLSTSEVTTSAGAALALNLSRYTVSEDLCVAVASALLQRLGEAQASSFTEDVTCNMLSALINFATQNKQVAQLAAVMDVGGSVVAPPERTANLLAALRTVISGP